MKKVLFGGKPLTLNATQPEIGSVAPNFSAVNSSLETVNLSDFKGKTILISSFPSVDTSVCAVQTRKFNAEAAKHPDVKVISISCDLPFAQKRFCSIEGLDNMVVLSDAAHTDFGEKYGMLIVELRLLARGVIIIDSEGIIRYREIVEEVTHEPDYDKALEALAKL